MNNADSNEKLDAETEPRKSDVLRAKDIIPSLKKPEDPAPVEQHRATRAIFLDQAATEFEFREAAELFVLR